MTFAPRNSQFKLPSKTRKSINTTNYSQKVDIFSGWKTETDLTEFCYWAEQRQQTKTKYETKRLSKLCVHYELLCNFGPICESLIDRSDRIIQQYKTEKQTDNKTNKSNTLLKTKEVKSRVIDEDWIDCGIPHREDKTTDDFGMKKGISTTSFDELSQTVQRGENNLLHDQNRTTPPLDSQIEEKECLNNSKSTRLTPDKVSVVGENGKPSSVTELERNLSKTKRLLSLHRSNPNEQSKSNVIDVISKPSIKYSYTQSKIELNPNNITKLERVPENLRNLLSKTKTKPQSAPSAYHGICCMKIEKKQPNSLPEQIEKRVFPKKTISLKKVTLRGNLGDEENEEVITTFPFFSASRPLKDTDNLDNSKKSVFPIVHLLQEDLESVEPFSCKLGPPGFRPGIGGKNVLHRARDVANKRMMNTIGLFNNSTSSASSFRRTSSASRKLGRLQCSSGTKIRTSEELITNLIHDNDLS
ncbi:DgyrCDS1072 [Dimorphilus gyrociliatus]|uniref:DgyrCDS1072 n=1 Tax=Dimorphilus gyrociliatus TaxID=2664684 RepID=A0A7I8VB89_9ANNE|nr:DgyrCDS1072 [Dimorphilus gyrociliatus]